MIDRIYRKMVDHNHPFKHIMDDDYGSILDLGCGDGRISKELAQIGETIVGVELERERLFKFQEQGVPENLHLVEGDATKLPFPEDEFDLVNSYTVFEHIPAELVQDYLGEIHRVTKPGGRIHIVNDTSFYRILRKTRLLKSEEGPDPSHINMVTPNTMARSIRDAGFEIEQVRYSPFHHFTNWSPSILSGVSTKGYVVATA